MAGRLDFPRKVHDVMVQRLRVLGLDVLSLASGGFTLIDEHRVGLSHVDLKGNTRDLIWLNPGLLIDRELEHGYGTEASMTHFPLRGRHSLVLCENLLDGLLVAQGLQVSSLAEDYTVATAGVWRTLPEEWLIDAWWLPWHEIRVVGGLDYGRIVQRMAGRDITVLAPIHLGGGWNPSTTSIWMEDWLNGGEYLPFGCPGEESDLGEVVLEDYAPQDIHGAYINGHLHYTVTMVEGRHAVVDDGNGQLTRVRLERRVVRVVKSDRTQQQVVESPAPPGTRQEERIFRLEDGTHVKCQPDGGEHGTWSGKSIRAFLQGESSVRPMSEMLEEILSFLRSKVWLPNPTDYYVLVLAVVTSFVQEIFDAVPLILVVGPKGTGKSDLSAAMASVSANGVFIARSTAATISRRIDKTRGFVALDDLEDVGSKTGAGQMLYTDLMQILKLSYKKKTALRDITEGNKIVRLNFYGVKVINNTRGTDEILGSRMLRINTAAKPAGLDLPTSDVDTDKLRDDLHTWAFSSVGMIADAYAAYPTVSNRSEEITAPLRVLARLSGVTAYETNLDAHLNPICLPSQSNLEDHLRDFLDKMIEREEQSVVPSQIHAELACRLVKAGITIPARLTPEWIGRQLRTMGYVAATDPGSRVRTPEGFVRRYNLVRPTRSEATTSRPAKPNDAPLPDVDGPDI